MILVNSKQWYRGFHYKKLMRKGSQDVWEKNIIATISVGEKWMDEN